MNKILYAADLDSIQKSFQRESNSIESVILAFLDKVKFMKDNTKDEAEFYKIRYIAGMTKNSLQRLIDINTELQTILTEAEVIAIPDRNKMPDEDNLSW